MNLSDITQTHTRTRTNTHTHTHTQTAIVQRLLVINKQMNQPYLQIFSLQFYVTDLLLSGTLHVRRCVLLFS